MIVYILSVVILVQTLVTGILIYKLVLLAGKERSDLEDRLMSVTQPVALVQHKALERSEPSKVEYVGEVEEWELTHGT